MKFLARFRRRGGARPKACLPGEEFGGAAVMWDQRDLGEWMERFRAGFPDHLKEVSTQSVKEDPYVYSQVSVGLDRWNGREKRQEFEALVAEKLREGWQIVRLHETQPELGCFVDYEVTMFAELRRPRTDRENAWWKNPL